MISVTIPIYKPNKHYIRQTLKSVNYQQGVDKIQVIISDDGGGEFVQTWIDDFENLDIIYIQNKGPKGIFSNLNNAIKHSKSELIHFLCQDDVLYPNFLKEMSDVLSNESSVFLVYNQADSMDETGQITKLNTNYPIKYKTIPQQLAVNALLKYGCYPGNLSTVMVKREIFEEVGFFDPNFKYSGDFEYWLRVAIKHNHAILLKPQIALRHHNERASLKLGSHIWLKENIIIYKKLLEVNSIDKSRLYLQLYINQQLGTTLVKEIVKTSLKDKSKLRPLLKLFRFPLNPHYAFFLFLVSLVKKNKLFKLKNITF